MKWWDWMPRPSLVFFDSWALSQLSYSPLSPSLRGSLVPLHFLPLRVVSSAYLRLVIFLPAVLIPACDLSSLAFRMMYSVCRLKAGGEGDDRGWDGWMASPTRWTWVWASSSSWWWTGKPGMLQSMGSPRVGHDLLNWTELVFTCQEPQRMKVSQASLDHHLLSSWWTVGKAVPFPHCCFNLRKSKVYLPVSL